MSGLVGRFGGALAVAAKRVPKWREHPDGAARLSGLERLELHPKTHRASFITRINDP